MADVNEAVELLIVEAADLVVKIIVSIGCPLVFEKEFNFLAKGSGLGRLSIHHLDPDFIKALSPFLFKPGSVLFPIAVEGPESFHCFFCSLSCL